MSAPNAIHALAPDERPAAATRPTRTRRDREPAAILIGSALLVERMADAITAQQHAHEALQEAIASGDALQVREAVRALNREARTAFGLIGAIHRDLSEHLRRHPCVRD